MVDLPDRTSRARAQGFEVFPYEAEEIGSADSTEWRIRACGVDNPALLNTWWFEAGAMVPVVGRVRVSRRRNAEADLAGLLELIRDEQPSVHVTEILNLELEPAFQGQRLGVCLLRTALADVPGEDLVVVQPVPSMFNNVSPATSVAAVIAFYANLGLVPDDRTPGYLIAKRARLRL